jgi:hypothetical protein
MKATEVNTEHTTGMLAQQEIPQHEASGIFETILYSNIINLLIVILFLVWIFRKFNLLSGLAKKRDEILETIKNLDEEKRIKKNNLEQTKTKIKNVNQEIEKIIDEGEHIADSIFTCWLSPNPFLFKKFFIIEACIVLCVFGK